LNIDLELGMGTVPPNLENISTPSVIDETIKLIPGFSYPKPFDDPMTWDLLRTRSFNYRINNIIWVRYLDLLIDQLLIVSDFNYRKIQKDVLPLILYVIQNDTHIKVIFNTYEEYRKRGEEKDKSLSVSGIIIIHINFTIIQIREKKSMPIPDLTDAAWNLIWSHTRPEIHPNMKLNQSMLDKIHPSDKYSGQYRRDSVGGPFINSITKERFPEVNKPSNPVKAIASSNTPSKSSMIQSTAAIARNKLVEKRRKIREEEEEERET
jgi:hypothetical protein